jgi:hypothetical protein
VLEVDHASDQDQMIAGVDLMLRPAVEPGNGFRDDGAAGLSWLPSHCCELVGLL